MSAALSYRAHAPLIDSLLQEVGIDGRSLQGLAPKLEEAPAARLASRGRMPSPEREPAKGGPRRRSGQRGGAGEARPPRVGA